VYGKADVRRAGAGNSKKRWLAGHVEGGRKVTISRGPLERNPGGKAWRGRGRLRSGGRSDPTNRPFIPWNSPNFAGGPQGRVPGAAHRGARTGFRGSECSPSDRSTFPGTLTLSNARGPLVQNIPKGDRMAGPIPISPQVGRICGGDWRIGFRVAYRVVGW